jgi:TPR repeat protein
LVPEPPGEKEFLAQNYAAAVPLLNAAAARGNLRAVFYLRIIHERGLGGLPINQAIANSSLDFLAYRFTVLTNLATDAPEKERPLYQTALATLYYLGRTPAKKPDLDAALSLADLAAKADFPPAINLMTAVTLAASPKDSPVFFATNGPRTAHSWATKGAELKDILAIGNLAYINRKGLGTHVNPYLAASLTHNAATNPFPTPRALNDLGYIYQEGIGVTKDLIEATRWRGLAAKRGFPLALGGSKGQGHLCLPADYIEY